MQLKEFKLLNTQDLQLEITRYNLYGIKLSSICQTQPEIMPKSV